jgi:hypothetical protein
MEAQYTFAWFKFTEDMVCVGLRRVCLFLWVPQAGPVGVASRESQRSLHPPLVVLPFTRQLSGVKLM